MSLAEKQTSKQQACDRTNGAMTLTLAVGALLDIATSTSLRLTDPEPSLAVVIFNLADGYTSPIALITFFMAGVFWLNRSAGGFKIFFDTTLWLSMIALLDNLVGLILCLFDKQDNPSFLLASACLVYFENIAVFTVFYWRFDHAHQNRIAAGEQIHPGIVFPHGSLPFKTLVGWRPKYLDYLFLSFNTASTFGPTLPIPLRGSIQLGMMLQVTIAMGVLVMLAARAVGLIG